MSFSSRADHIFPEVVGGSEVMALALFCIEEWQQSLSVEWPALIQRSLWVLLDSCNNSGENLPANLFRLCRNDPAR